MQILKARWIITGGENCEILKNKAVAFDGQIRAVGDADELLAKFGDAKFIDFTSGNFTGFKDADFAGLRDGNFASLQDADFASSFTGSKNTASKNSTSSIGTDFANTGGMGFANTDDAGAISGKNINFSGTNFASLNSAESANFAGSKSTSRDAKRANFTELNGGVIAPSFVNTHVHLEFSANQTSLIYGDFVRWLGSIVEFGGELAQKCTQEVMTRALKTLIKSGVGAIGAVSSFGKDLQILAHSPVRTVFFNEILGSNPAVREQNFAAFKARFEASERHARERFTPAVSLHSPYSVHPELAKLALDFAREKEALVCTHFLESEHELKWLTHGTGAFEAHLRRFVPQPEPMYSPSSFLAMFAGLRTLFTHCVWADFKELKFDPEFHSVTHCAVSNRLLGARALDLDAPARAGLGLNLGTDGLSSNFSLNFWDELRAALFTHANCELTELARRIFTAATHGGAQALGLNSGQIRAGKNADIAVYSAPEGVSAEQLIVQMILHTRECERLYVGGERVRF